MDRYRAFPSRLRSILITGLVFGCGSGDPGDATNSGGWTGSTLVGGTSGEFGAPSSGGASLGTGGGARDGGLPSELGATGGISSATEDPGSGSGGTTGTQPASGGGGETGGADTLSTGDAVATAPEGGTGSSPVTIAGNGGTGGSSPSGGRFSQSGATSSVGGSLGGALGDGGASGASEIPGEAGGPAAGGGSGTPTSGCGHQAPESAPESVDVDSVTRTFIVDLPSNYDPDVPAPVLFALHGMGIDGAFFKSWANLGSAFGDRYVVVYPNALENSSGVTEWLSHEMPDIYFFDAMLELLSTTYCLDAERIFVTGHSSGGYETNAIGCRRSDVIRGIAPQSGAGPIVSPCEGPVAAIIIHGDHDPGVLPVEGENSRDYWGNAAHCSLASSSPASFNEVCVEYSGCDEGYRLAYCSYDGDHNLWSEAPQAMLDFFESL